MRKDILNIKMEDLTSSHAIENMFALLAALFFLAFALVPFIEKGMYANMINAIVGATSLTVALAFFLYTFSLYGLKSKEGWSWSVLSASLLAVLLAYIADAFGSTFLYFLLRFISIPLLTLGLGIKLWFTGLDLDLSQKTVASMTMIGWILLIFVSTILPATEGGFDYTKDSYAFFAIAEIFAFMIAIFVIQSIKARGWYILAVGLLLISMGDIFHPLAQQYGLIYPGTPLRLLWYLGLLTAGYGAYYQRKEHLKIIAM